jgi:parallel beta-helix repeat protein
MGAGLSLWIFMLYICMCALSSPVQAEVTLCGEPLYPNDHGIYRLNGVVECSDLNILVINENGAQVDLRGFKLIGNDNTAQVGILIPRGTENVSIVGGLVTRCGTALYVDRANNCEIQFFKAIKNTDKAIRIRGDNNWIVKSLCQDAGNDCFELRGNHNIAEECTAINSGTPTEAAQGFDFRGSGSANKCSAIGSSADGFQIQAGVSDVTIERCVAVNNAGNGIWIEATNTDNIIKANIAFSNGDGVAKFDLSDGNLDCESNTWKENKFKTSNIPCID